MKSEGGKTQIVWPGGSTWHIGSKNTGDIGDSGKLVAAVLYREN